MGQKTQGQTRVTSDFLKQFGGAVRAVRKQLPASKRSQEKIADEMGGNTHANTILNLERHGTNITLDTAERLAKALGVPLCQLIALAENSRQTAHDKIIERLRRSPLAKTDRIDESDLDWLKTIPVERLLGCEEPSDISLALLVKAKKTCKI